MPPRGIKRQESTAGSKVKSCAGSRRKDKRLVIAKDKLLVINEWSSSSSSENEDGIEGGPSHCKQKGITSTPSIETLAVKDASEDKTVATAVDTLGAKDASEDKTATTPVEPLAATDGPEDKTPQGPVEAVACKDGSQDKTPEAPVEDVIVKGAPGDKESVPFFQVVVGLVGFNRTAKQVPPSPTRLSQVVRRSPSPMKLERDFVPSSIASSACVSPVNTESKVTWHAPLVYYNDGPPSKRSKSSREATPKTPDA